MPGLGYPLGFPLGAEDGLQPLDYVQRMVELYPNGWVSQDSKNPPPGGLPNPTKSIFWSLLLAIAQQLSYVDNQDASQLLKRQERLATADGTNLDDWVRSFFSGVTSRQSGETDASFRQRIQGLIQSLIAFGGGNRESMRQAFLKLTGLEPRLVEPWRTADVGAWAIQMPVTQGGATGSTKYAYTVQALNSMGYPILTITAITVTGNAALSVTNFNTLTFTSFLPAGTVALNIYRTTGGGTQGPLALNLGALTPYSDVGIPAINATFPSAVSFLSTDQRTCPFRWGAQAGQACTVTQVGAAGFLHMAYAIVARDAAGNAINQFLGRTNTAATPLTSSNYNVISWPAWSSASSYDVYRIAANGVATPGRIATTSTLTTNDQGGAGVAGLPPSITTAGLAGYGFVDTAFPLAPPLVAQNTYDAANAVRPFGSTIGVRINTIAQLAALTS